MQALRDAAIEERLKVAGSRGYESARREAALEAGEKPRLRRASCRAIPSRVQKPMFQLPVPPSRPAGYCAGDVRRRHRDASRCIRGRQRRGLECSRPSGASRLRAENAARRDTSRPRRGQVGYVKREGSARVPTDHQENGFALGRRVRHARSRFAAGELSRNRQKRLGAPRLLNSQLSLGRRPQRRGWHARPSDV
jgi:hypothetical protein